MFEDLYRNILSVKISNSTKSSRRMSERRGRMSTDELINARLDASKRMSSRRLELSSEQRKDEQESAKRGMAKRR